MSNMNLDPNMIGKLKDMMNKGELNDVISKIPPEMMQNFSSMMSGGTNNVNSENSNEQNDSSNFNTDFNNNFNSNNTNNNSNDSNPLNNFDFSKIDMNTIMKMQSIMGKMNNKNDPRSNLLHSLKPYLRDGKKDKIDQYSNLLNIANIANIADIFQNNNKETNNE